MRNAVLILLLLLFSGQAGAEEPSLSLGAGYEIPLPQAPAEGGLSSFQPNYFLLWSQSSLGHSLRQQEEASFQLSMQTTFTRLGQFEVMGAYTQNSFWQIYDQEQSRPFRETNYAPQIFIKSPLWGDSFPLRLEAGYIHQSNGGGLETSRSWDRTFLGIYHQGEHWQMHHRVWNRLDEDPKAYPNDPKGDENPDIQEHYGNQEGQYQWFLGNYSLFLKERYNPTTGHGLIEVMTSGPVPSSSLHWMAYYLNGYGESLADYDQTLTKWGIGVIFSP